MKTIMVNPLGLITQPNEYGQFPMGAMSVATNVEMRDLGVIGSLPAIQTLRATANLSTVLPRRLFASDANSTVLVVARGITSDSGAAGVRIEWVDGSSNTAVSNRYQNTTIGFTEPEFAQAIAKDRGRYFITTPRGISVLDSEGDSTSREAGLLTPQGVYVSSVQTSDAQSLATGYNRRYRVALRREHSDGYIQTGPVSNTCDVQNASGSTIDPVVSVAVSASHATFFTAIAGDIIEVYRTPDQLIGVDPGDTFFLAKKYTLLSGDLTGSYTVTIRDVSLDSGLAVELYTNPGQEGPLNTNLAPPLAEDLVTYNGYLLFLARRIAPIFKFKLNAKLGSLSTTQERTYGIGTRVVTGDTTNASGSILNVSPTTGLEIGQLVTGTGMAVDARVTNVSGTTVTVSPVATATNAGVSLTFTDTLEVTGSAIADLVAVTNHASLASTVLRAGVYMLTDKPTTTYVAAGPTLSTPEQQGAEYTLTHFLYGDSTGFPLAIRATNGQNYSPSLPSTSGTAVTGSYDERFNRWFYSKLQQPEHVTVESKFTVGSGKNYRGVSVGGVVLVFASDGLWQLTGPPWAQYQLDPTLIIASRHAVGAMDNLAWAYTNRGLVSITPQGDVTEISSGRVGQAATSDEFAGAGFTDTFLTYLVCDELHHRVYVTTNGGDTFMVYDARTNAFTRFSPTTDARAAIYSRFLKSLVFANTASPSVLEYFNADSSNTRHASAECRFQPFYLDDPSSLKEWVDLEFTFDGVTQGAMSLTPSFSGTNYTARTVALNATQSRARVAVPRNAPAISPELRPGFTFASGGTTNPWSLRALALSVVPASEEGKAR